MIIPSYNSYKNIQFVLKKFGIKRENRKYLVSGPWRQSWGPFLDNIPGLKSESILFYLNCAFYYLLYIGIPYSVFECAQNSHRSPLNLR